MTDGQDQYDATDDPGATQTDGGVLESDDESYEPGGRRRGRKRRSLPGCIAVLVALAVVVGGFYFVVSWGIDTVRDQFQSAEDYPGPGHGRVVFEVEQGDTVAEMGRNLKAAGVVASVDAFTAAAVANPESNQIQFGYLRAPEGDGRRRRGRHPGRPRRTW